MKTLFIKFYNYSCGLQSRVLVVSVYFGTTNNLCFYHKSVVRISRAKIYFRHFTANFVTIILDSLRFTVWLVAKMSSTVLEGNDKKEGMALTSHESLSGL